MREIEEAKNPVPNAEEAQVLFERLYNTIGKELYGAVVAPLFVGSQRGLNLPLRLLQNASGLGKGKGKDEERFRRVVLEQLTHLFRVDRKRNWMSVLEKDVFAWMKVEGTVEKIRVDVKGAHGLMAKLSESLLDNPECEQYCRSAIVWHYCVSEQFDQLVNLLCTDLNWLIKVLQYCNVAKEMEAYFNAEVAPELKELLSILTNGHTAILHDHREIVSQILGRSNKTESKLWQQASTFRFPSAGSWKPMKATLVSLDEIYSHSSTSCL